MCHKRVKSQNENKAIAVMPLDMEISSLECSAIVFFFSNSDTVEQFVTYFHCLMKSGITWLAAKM